MKYFQFKCVLLALLTLGFISSSYAQDNSKLTIFVDNSYPPYMYETEATAAEGLYPRLLDEIVRQAGHEADIKAYPWKRALLFSEAGKGAVGGAYKNDERIKTYDFSNPLYQEKLVIFVNKKSTFEYSAIEDLKGKIIGVNRGWSYGQAFDEARKSELFSVHVSNDPSDNFKMLALGRIDCVILEKKSGDLYTRALGISDRVGSLPQAFSVNSGYLIVPKKLEMTKFLDDVNVALEKIQEDGTYDSIVETALQGTVKEL